MVILMDKAALEEQCDKEGGNHKGVLTSAVGGSKRKRNSHKTNCGQREKAGGKIANTKY